MSAPTIYTPEQVDEINAAWAKENDALRRRIEQLEADVRTAASGTAQAWSEAAALREQVAAATTLVNETTMRTNVADAVAKLGAPARAAQAWGATVAEVHGALHYSDTPIAPPIAAALGVRYVEMYMPDPDAAALSQSYRADAIQYR